MSSLHLSRAAAAVAVASLVGALVASTASADEPEPAPAATLALGTLETLTLPAADGVRDTANLSIAADLATTVSLVVRPAGGGDTLADLGSVEIADPATPASVSVSVAGLPAGALEVAATPTGGSEVTAPLTVGSGEPSTVSLSLSASSIFTWSKATPRSTTATVSAVDETGLNVPFVGTVTAKVGTKTSAVSVASTTGAAASAAFPVSKFVAGTGTVSATVHGASAVNYSATPATLKVLQTAVTGLTLKPSVTTVYPAKDSYRDTMKFTVTPKTTTGKSFASTGTVTITYKGKTVKSWKLTSSAAKSLTWDGKNKGKIVPGTYTVTAKLKGPEGSTKTVKTTVKVDSGKLKTKTKTITYKASSVLKKTDDDSVDHDGICEAQRSGAVYCSSGANDGIALWSYGSMTVPADVVAAEKYGSKAAVYLQGLDGYGSGAWGYDVVSLGGSKIGPLKGGTSTLGYLALPVATKKVHVTVALSTYTVIEIASVKVKYTYKVMTH